MGKKRRRQVTNKTEEQRQLTGRGRKERQKLDRWKNILGLPGVSDESIEHVVKAVDNRIRGRKLDDITAGDV